MGFRVFAIISLVTHLAEVGVNSLLAYLLWSDEEWRVWFSLISGLIIIPLVTIQLVSAILFLRCQNDNLPSWRLIVMAVLHVFQLGFHWRHLSILFERDAKNIQKEKSEIVLLRLIYTFTSSLPLLLIMTFLMLSGFIHSLLIILIIYATTGITLISASWAVAGHEHLNQSQTESGDKCFGMFLRFLWRAGEIIVRILSLSLFAMLYYQWIFLVLALHWITMCLCVCTSVIAGIKGNGFCRVMEGMATAYVYNFCFINYGQSNLAFRYSIFYIIMFLENTTLCIVWLVMVDMFGLEFFLYIALGAFLTSTASMCIYFIFFHVQITHSLDEKKEEMCASNECYNCKLSMCAKHNEELHRAYYTHSQYERSLTNEQFYKHLLQESFTESSVPGDRQSTISTVLTNENFDFRRLEALSDEERRSILSFLSSRNYVHRRYMEQLVHPPVDGWSDYTTETPSTSHDRFSCFSSDTESSPCEPWPEQEHYVPKLSVMLTENCDAIQETEHGKVYLKRLDSFHSLLRRDGPNLNLVNLDPQTKLSWQQLPVNGPNSRKYNASQQDESDSCSSGPTSRPTRRDVRKKDKARVRVAGRSERRGDKSYSKSKSRKGKIKRNTRYVNEDNGVYMEMSSPAKRTPPFYENVAYTDEILTQPEKVFKISRGNENKKAPWYTCSESGDSALPTETFSSTSNCALTDVDNDSNSNQEFRI